MKTLDQLKRQRPRFIIHGFYEDGRMGYASSPFGSEEAARNAVPEYLRRENENTDRSNEYSKQAAERWGYEYHPSKHLTGAVVIRRNDDVVYEYRLSNEELGSPSEIFMNDHLLQNASVT